MICAVAGACKNAIVIVDPLTSWKPVIAEARGRGMVVCVVVTNLLPTRQDLIPFTPTKETLISAGVADVYISPQPVGFDVYACTLHLKELAQKRGYSYAAVIPLGETPVEYSDTLSALLGLNHHNALATVHSRREKGFMKDSVAAAGLQTAQYSRLYKPDDVSSAMSTLGLSFPVVIKTPHGMSTTDVYICDTEKEACERTAQIIGHFGPDSRAVTSALLEEYIGGDEFACNMVASPHLEGGVCISDVWKYGKSKSNGTARYDRADMMSPADPAIASVVSYAAAVARAVGVEYGAAHVELKATFSTQEQVRRCM
jgi:D-alanine-D-alanine ligase-like ATP-grasp enzyme